MDLNKRLVELTSSFLLAILLSAASLAAIPEKISYQGRLTDALGSPIAGNHSLTFNIYDVAVGGAALWSETQNPVAVTDGLFAVLLGNVSPFPAALFEGANRYIGVQINGQPELAPRKQIVGVAYALRVASINGASGGQVTGDTWINGRLVVGNGDATGIAAFTAGYNSSSSGNYSSVTGGADNSATGYGATVAGGVSNIASGDSSFVAGGGGNVASGANAFIGGGRQNLAEGRMSHIGGGWLNYTSALYATIGGGERDSATAQWATVAGGRNNDAEGGYSTICGGTNNRAVGTRSFIGGGVGNQVDGFDAAVVSGENCQALAGGAFVGGGDDNWAHAANSTIAGGFSNFVTSNFATIAGGHNNVASGDTSFVGGGSQNVIGAACATIAGGSHNTVNGEFSGVFSGVSNNVTDNHSIICGGATNTNNGSYSVILGGSNNQVQDITNPLPLAVNYSMAFGTNVVVRSSNRVMFFDGTNDGRFGINRDSDDGGLSHPIHVGTDNTNGNGAHLTAAGVWTNASSRSFKENFLDVANNGVLDKIAALEISHYNYSGTAEKHIGPMAEDFSALFEVGAVHDDGSVDNKYLSPGDVAGVSLAGVKQLIRKNTELEQRVSQLESMLRELIAAQKP